MTALARTPPTEPITGCNWITGNATEPEAFLDQLPETINALTFCPGKVILGPIKRLKPEQMLEAYQTNVLDAFTLIQALLPRLEGSVVFISSVAATTGCPVIVRYPPRNQGWRDSPLPSPLTWLPKYGSMWWHQP